MYQYQLKTDSINHNIIVNVFKNKYKKAYYTLDDDGSPMSKDIYWHNAIKDTLEFSKEFPLVLFILHEWHNVTHFVTYIKDGKWYEAHVIESISPFNESKLK